MAPDMKAHIDRRIDDCFTADLIRVMRADCRGDFFQ
jgi:hypothetical protein